MKESEEVARQRVLSYEKRLWEAMLAVVTEFYSDENNEDKLALVRSMIEDFDNLDDPALAELCDLTTPIQGQYLDVMLHISRTYRQRKAQP